MECTNLEIAIAGLCEYFRVDREHESVDVPLGSAADDCEVGEGGIVVIRGETLAKGVSLLTVVQSGHVARD